MQSAQNYSHVIWDWNGTLFDDVGWCITVMNRLLASRNLKPLGGIAEYHRVFCFPVINYYRNVGFDLEKESFEDLAEEYVAMYHAGKTGNCTLRQNAVFVLETLKQRHATQVVLSATKTSDLLSQMSAFPILSYFDETLGLSDIYAKSKIDVGLDYIARKTIKRALLIGDTAHDYETAKALGADCLLIAGGHQSKERLLTCGVPVLDDLLEIGEYISIT